MGDNSKRVVVTGIGALTPIGNSAPAYWDGLLAGTSGAASVTYFDASEWSAQFACELKNFDPLAFFDRKEARKLDPYAQYALVAADEAVVDAGLDVETLSQDKKDRIGVIVSSGIGGIQTLQAQAVGLHTGGPRRISPFFIPLMIPDIAAGHISIKYGFRGPNYAVVSACATSNNSMSDAFMMIQRGMLDGALCGGAEAAICELGMGGFASMKALSTRNDDPATASRPFDATRDGFVLGEGAGVLYIERLDHALARGANIYGEIIGAGMSGDAHHITAPDPTGSGAVLAMKMALNDAGIEASDVDYLNMHGTSTPLGDKAETQAIKQVFGEHAYAMNLSSTKSMTGHLLGAAGAVEAIASLMALKTGVIPPTINFSTPDPDCDLNYTFNKPQERSINVALSNAFGFGGHNTSVLFKRYEA
ncbi:MAG: beta-ketoacyl-[acyl-carrier-protein] synthase II [Bacteroidetes bacterium]|jgi:3-oxoacyl-[acyl-carrier-protein] synthase II|nr:beta-ketoacyl-[acyl-carrier-protein] synthase II [Bacteroidota bacterium]